MKFLGFEQIFQNAVTGMPIGGGKGRADFDPRGRSDMEVMRFCQSFMTELYRHIGEYTDVPAGTPGLAPVGSATCSASTRGSPTATSPGCSPARASSGAAPSCGPRRPAMARPTSPRRCARREATRSTAAPSSCPVRATSPSTRIEKVHELGGTVVACSDFDGVAHDPKGIDLDLLEQVKEVERGRTRDYVERRGDGARYLQHGTIREIPCEVALPCATQNELTGKDAAAPIRNGCIAVAEGANLPTTPEGVRAFAEAGIPFGPGKAANAGGVATSALEMQRNASRDRWTFEHTEERLAEIMVGIHRLCYETADEFGAPGNYVKGANIAGFLRVARAMVALGVI